VVCQIRPAPCRQPACFASAKVRRFVTPTSPPTRADANGFYWVSAPNVVPLVVTNRIGNEIAPAVCRLLDDSLPRVTVTGCPPKTKAAFRVALLDWRNGVRTFTATFCKRTSQSYFIGALAAAPGSTATLCASPPVSLKPLWLLTGCVARCIVLEYVFNRAVKFSPVIGRANARSAQAPSF
jgi:hypothetical protein